MRDNEPICGECRRVNGVMELYNPHDGWKPWESYPYGPEPEQLAALFGVRWGSTVSIHGVFSIFLWFPDRPQTKAAHDEIRPQVDAAIEERGWRDKLPGVLVFCGPSNPFG